MASKRRDRGGGAVQTGDRMEGKSSASLSRAERRRLEREGALTGEERRPRRRAERAGSSSVRGGEELRFTLLNGILGGAGVLTVVLGFVLLAQGSITLAPVLLVLGYGVLLPLALFL